MSSNDDTKQWFAFYTKSKHEKSVNSNLESQGYEVYLPLLIKIKYFWKYKFFISFPVIRTSSINFFSCLN